VTGLYDVLQLTEYEMMIAGHLVEPSAIPISWADIAGLENVIQELRETVILPIQKKELFVDSQLTQPPKGTTATVFTFSHSMNKINLACACMRTHTHTHQLRK
jgi:hypothetical protein